MAGTSLLTAIVGALLAGSAAMAQQAPAGPKPGPEIEALKVLARDWTFQSHIVEGMLWKDAPSAPAHGVWKCDWVMGGLWASCYMEDWLGPVKDGTGPLANGGILGWKGQMFVGWDIEDKVYRMIGVDSEAGAYDWVGRRKGEKFIFVSKDYRTSQGMQQRFRFTWDFADPRAVKFSQENQYKGDTVWRPFEIAVYTPTTLPR
jgi:hypothetical protein